MNHTVRIALSIILLSLCFYQPAIAVQDDVTVSKDILVFQDTDLRHTAQSIITMPSDSGRYYDVDKLSFDFFNSAIWCSFSLSNNTENLAERYLWINNADFYSIELYTFVNGKSQDIQLDGKSVPVSAKRIKHNTPLMRIVIPAKGELKCLLRIYKLGGAVVLPLKILRADELVVQEDAESDINLFYYGMQIFVVIFNLVLLLLMRRWLYLKYALYVLFSALSICGISGYSSSFIYPEFAWLTVRDTVFFNFPGTIFLLLFVQDFLRLPVSRPHVNAVFNYMIYALGFGFILSLCPPFYVGIASLYSNITTLLAILLVIGTAVASLKHNRTSAVFISRIPMRCSVWILRLRSKHSHSRLRSLMVFAEMRSRNAVL